MNAQRPEVTFTTPVGRMVWGSLYKRKMEDYDGNPLKPLDGKPHPGFLEFGLAVAKAPGETHWANSPFGAIIWAEGHGSHPQSATRNDFAWKVADGDSKTPGKAHKGKPGRAPCEKAGYPGHWVYSFRTMLDVKHVNANGSAYILEADAILPGDMVQVFGSVAGNTGATPGVYLNPKVVSLQGYHQDGRIATEGPDPTTLGFGTAARPAGMVNVPVGAMVAPPATVAPPAANPPPPPAAQAPQQMVPQVPVTPAPGFVPVPGASAAPPPPPGAAVAAPPPPPPAGPTMTAKANGLSYASFIASGWNDAALRANGYMT